MLKEELIQFWVAKAVKRRRMEITLLTEVSVVDAILQHICDIHICTCRRHNLFRMKLCT